MQLNLVRFINFQLVYLFSMKGGYLHFSIVRNRETIFHLITTVEPKYDFELKQSQRCGFISIYVVSRVEFVNRIFINQIYVSHEGSTF